MAHNAHTCETVPPGGTLHVICCSADGVHKLSIDNGVPTDDPITTPDILGTVNSAAQFSADEIVIAAELPCPFVCNTTSGKLIPLERVANYDLLAVVYLPQWKLLVTAGDGGEPNVVVWIRSPEDEEVPFHVKCEMGGHTNDVNILDARDDGSNRVVSGSFDCSARIWDVSKGKCVGILPNSGRVRGLCHDSEKRVQFTSGRGKLRGWDMRTDQQMISWTIPSLNGAVCYRQKKNHLVACTPQLRGGSLIQVMDMRMVRKGVTGILNRWYSTGGYLHSCCDLEDLDIFVTSPFNGHVVKGWREDGKCVWKWECPSYSNRKIARFVNGDPADPFLEEQIRSEQEKDMCHFLVEFCPFSLKIQVNWQVLSWWKWILL